MPPSWGRLLTAFGSAVRGAELPDDLDLGVAFTGSGDLLALYEDLVRLSGEDLRRAGPVARERALLGAVLLYEQEPGAYTRAQMGSMTERMEKGSDERRVAALAAQFGLHHRHIRTAIDFAAAHREDIEAQVAANDAAADQAQRLARQRAGLMAS